MENNKNTLIAAGAAFGAGLVIGALLMKSKGSDKQSDEKSESKTVAIENYPSWKKEFADKISKTAVFYQDFPKNGVTFMDLFSLTSNPQFFAELNKNTTTIIDQEIGAKSFDVIIGLESRGFIQGPILAQHYGVPFVPIRKKGKLPGECWSQEYGTEYSKDVCEIQKDSLKSGDRVLLVDDLLATGGTLKAAEDLVNKIPGTQVIGSYVLFEIPFLKGASKLKSKLVAAVQLED